MNNQINRAKTFVSSHIPHIVAAASAVTAVGVIVFYERKTLIEITPEHVRRLEEYGGRFTFVALDHVFHMYLAD